MAIVAMLAQLPPGSRLYGLAADRDQGWVLIDSIQGFALRTPELRGLLDVQAYQVAAVRNGSLLEVLAADAPGDWGLRPAFVVVDELCQSRAFRARGRAYGWAEGGGEGAASASVAESRRQS